jgi:hypothetical protein
LEVFIGEGGDDLFSLLRSYGNYSKIVFDGMFFNILKDVVDPGPIFKGDEDAAHEAPGLLVDIDAYVLGRAVLIEGIFDVLIGIITIDVLDIKAGELL